MGFLRDLFGDRQPCDLCQIGKASWPSDRAAVADWRVSADGLDASLFVCGSCRQAVLDLQITHPLVAVTSLIVLGHAAHPFPYSYLQHPQWRKILLHALSVAGARPVDEFDAALHVERIEGAFFRDIVDGRPHLRGFRPSEPAAIRQAIRGGYDSYVASAVARRVVPDEERDSQVLSPGIVSAFSNYYLPNIRDSTHDLLSHILRHVVPFLALKPGDAVDALAEYVVWRETGDSPHVDWLGHQVREAEPATPLRSTVSRNSRDSTGSR
jgi:hypothetical protein